MIPEQIKWISNYFDAEPKNNTTTNDNMNWAEWHLSKYYIIVFENNKHGTWFAISDKHFPITKRRSHTIIHSLMPKTESYFKLMMKAINISK